MKHLEALSLPRPKNPIFWLALSLWLVGTAVAVSFVFVQSHKAAEARGAEQELLEAMMDNDAAILSVDPHGMVRTWNQGAEDVFGYTAHEIKGRPLAALMPEDIGRAHEKHLGEMFGAGSPFHVIAATCVMKSKSGQAVPVMVKIYISKKSGLAVAVANRLSDVRVTSAK